MAADDRSQPVTTRVYVEAEAAPCSLAGMTASPPSPGCVPAGSRVSLCQSQQMGRNRAGGLSDGVVVAESVAHQGKQRSGVVPRLPKRDAEGKAGDGSVSVGKVVVVESPVAGSSVDKPPSTQSWVSGGEWRPITDEPASTQVLSEDASGNGTKAKHSDGGSECLCKGSRSSLPVSSSFQG